MLHNDKRYGLETDILSAGHFAPRPVDSPEILPIYMTNQFQPEDLDDLIRRNKSRNFGYNRNGNPNRSSLAEAMTCLEGGVASEACTSGMGAIFTSIMAVVKQGDHVVASNVLYGETYEIFNDILSQFGVETTFLDITDLDAVKAAMRPNTVLVYTETLANPLCVASDIRSLAEIAHGNNARLIVDNTFMTGALYRPLEDGADIVVNSVTKFVNGHNDVTAGSATSNDEDLIKKIHHIQILAGTMTDPFASWLALRGIRTISLRMERACQNAAALAKAFSESPYVLKVHHPSLETAKDHELAKRQFHGHYGPMLAIDLPEDRDKISAFLRACNLGHYAGTLGGYTTTFSYPPLSSHDTMTTEELYAINITQGTLRISCGIEKTEDLVTDMLEALEVAYGKH